MGRCTYLSAQLSSRTAPRHEFSHFVNMWVAESIIRGASRGSGAVCGSKTINNRRAAEENAAGLQNDSRNQEEVVF